jgi:hypothetical protein
MKSALAAKKSYTSKMYSRSDTKSVLLQLAVLLQFIYSELERQWVELNAITILSFFKALTWFSAR